MSEPIIIKLSQLKKGKEAIIRSFSDGEISLKLMEMGCLPGEIITVEKYAPLGDPMAVKVAGYTLSLRKKEAEVMMVEEK